mgnify:CR=1 FL=1
MELSFRVVIRMTVIIHPETSTHVVVGLYSADFLGIDVRRIRYSWVSAAEGAKWADLVNETVAGIRELGPYLEYQKASDYLEKEAIYE